MTTTTAHPVPAALTRVDDGTTTHPVPPVPPPWSDVADAIWRRSLAEQDAAVRGDESTHDEPEEG